MLGLTGKELGVMAKVLKRILSLRNPTHYLLTWLGLKGRR